MSPISRGSPKPPRTPGRLERRPTGRHELRRPGGEIPRRRYRAHIWEPTSTLRMPIARRRGRKLSIGPSEGGIRPRQQRGKGHRRTPALRPRASARGPLSPHPHWSDPPPPRPPQGDLPVGLTGNSAPSPGDTRPAVPPFAEIGMRPISPRSVSGPLHGGTQLGETRRPSRDKAKQPANPGRYMK